jgi:CBS domain-containing protein
MPSSSDLLAAAIMERDVATASPRWTVTELERQLCEKKVSGFPVVDGRELVGVVSRADVIRQGAIEHSRAGEISDHFRRDDCDREEELRALVEEKRFAAERLANLRVADVMSPPTFVASPDMTIREVAELLIQHRIHRVPVADGAALVGIISTLDIVELVARGDLSRPPAADQ